MADQYDDQDADTLEVQGEPKSSARVLAAIKKAERSFNDYQELCDRIDDIYSREDCYSEDKWTDNEYDLFWASDEVLKQAIYARPPKPVVSPQFKDRRPLQNTTAELLERTTISAFDRTSIDEGMLCCRDDLIFYNRGQLWLTYETDEKGGGQRVCVEHLDRKDFLHPPARKWSDVPWVARRAWMTPKAMEKRFESKSKDAYKDATLAPNMDNESDVRSEKAKQAGVWEVWHKADNRVYWVADGVNVYLDDDKPHLKLRGFFPCPRPAYGTLKPRSLKPVPDYVRYAGHFKKINSLTSRIYSLLDMIRMKGLIAGGGEVGDAVEQLIKDDSNASMLIPVASAGLTANGKLVEWLPLAEIATAIQGLIEARRELFSDYDRLSGISDIMRGETEAEETLGAQQLKSQYGSVRVKGKIDELQRLARDVTQISAEIMAENFSQETLLEMSQMEIPTKAEIEKQVNEIEKDAKEELEGLKTKAEKAAEEARQQPNQDPQQMQQMAQQGQQQFQQAQQQVIAKYAPMLKDASEQVPIEDVMDLLRDDKARGFAFEIETDSTILTDEIQEKASRNEFLTAFTSAAAGVLSLAQAGEAGAKLAGGILKFSLQPYRVGRELNGLIDEFIDAAPQMAAAMAKDGDQDANSAMAAANMKLAEAEIGKAQAAIAKVQADTQSKQQEMQLKAAEAQAKASADQQRIGLEVEQTRGSIEKTGAEIEKIWAEIAKLGVDATNQTRQQDRDDVKAVADIESRQTDQAMQAEQHNRAAFENDRDAAMGDRQQTHTEQQGERTENRADRQQDFSERSADRQMSLAEKQAAKETA